MPDKLHFQRPDLDRALNSHQRVLLRWAADTAAAHRMPLYLVGGFVRDLLLGWKTGDFDLVAEGDAIALARALAAQHGGRVTAHTRFGTAQWHLPETGRPPLDFITTRSESYKHPAALPSVKPGRLTDDLKRRDFTINTLALRLDGDHWGELRDDLGGLEDLKGGQVRVLHAGSFQDDPTRLFRAARYEQRYGFEIAPETLALIPAARRLIALLSPERTRHELDLILEEEKTTAMLDRLQELNLLRAVHPALAWNRSVHERLLNGLQRLTCYPFKSGSSPESRGFFGWHFWLMQVPRSGLEGLDQRLHFRASLLRSLVAASDLFAALPALAGSKPSRWVERLDELPLTAVQAVFLAASGGLAQKDLFNYLETWRQMRPKTNGHDLKKRDLQAGPVYQQILKRLRAAWLDGEVETEAEEQALLDELISDKENHSGHPGDR